MANDRRELIDDLGAANRASQRGWQAALWTALPCTITAFDPARMTCEAQPAIQAKVRDQFGVERWETMPILVDVPVVFPSGGGFTLTFPVAVGDEALVVFASRCIDSWWQSGGVQVQAELRMHSLSDGFALVGPRSQPRVLPGLSATDVQLRSDDGATYVAIQGDGKIALVSASEVDVTAPTMNLNGSVNITGELTVAGKVTAEDFATEDPNLPSYSHHTHFSRTDDSARTSVPNVGT